MSEAVFLPVEDVMTRNPQRIDGLATIEEALVRMDHGHVSSLIMERRDAQDEFGLLLVADIAREVIGRNRSPRRTNVYEIAVKPAPAVDADMDIRYAVRHMARMQLSHCVVMRARELVGIVTIRDMTLRYLEKERSSGPPVRDA